MKIPETPPSLRDLLAKQDFERMPELFAGVAQDLNRYLHWDELKYRKAPNDWSRETWWLALKLKRINSQKHLAVLKDKQGKPFAYGLPDVLLELIHRIDREGGTMLGVSTQVTNAAERDRYLVRSLMEEAISSSQLEGAATTREAAKRMLADGRPPRDKSERMILNNFLTMKRIIEWKDHKLTPELLLEIHRQLSEDALDVPDGAGRFRRDDESIDVSDMEGTVFHIPPPASELDGRIAAMCAFANGETPADFMHPVVRGIILHFWLAYDHPFADGNGRTARALFYWQMLRQGYWLFEFVSISQFLRKSPTKYGLAFLHTETDGNDLTYFIIHQVEVIRQSLAELHDYVAKKSEEVAACTHLLHQFSGLNHRQLAILAHAIKNPGYPYSVGGHQMSHNTAYDTARNDLLSLADLGLLEHRKVGKAHSFIAPKNLRERLAKT